MLDMPPNWPIAIATCVSWYEISVKLDDPRFTIMLYLFPDWSTDEMTRVSSYALLSKPITFASLEVYQQSKSASEYCNFM